MNARFKTYVAVCFEKDGVINTKFVTGLEGMSTALWEDGKPAMSFGESWAKDIVLGLTWNGYAATVFRVLDGVRLSNPPGKTEESA